MLVLQLVVLVEQFFPGLHAHTSAKRFPSVGTLKKGLRCATGRGMVLVRGWPLHWAGPLAGRNRPIGSKVATFEPFAFLEYCSPVSGVKGQSFGLLVRDRKRAKMRRNVPIDTPRWRGDGSRRMEALRGPIPLAAHLIEELDDGDEQAVVYGMNSFHQSSGLLL